MTDSISSEDISHPEKAENQTLTNTVGVTQRLHYMDNVRALAMFVGVLFHAALAYSPLLHNIWFTTSDQSSPLFDLFSWFIHLFRMPVFFLISGFFAIMLIQKRGLFGFLKNRSLRILIPFIIFMPLLILTVLASVGWALDNVENLSPLLSFINRMKDVPDAPASPISTMHLWFLYYLFMFVVITALLYKTKFFEFKILSKITSAPLTLTVFPLLLVPALFSVVTPHPAADKIYPEIWAFGFYGLFFLLGSIIFLKPQVLEQFNKYKHALLIVSLALYAYFYSTLPDTISTEMILLMMAGMKMELSHLPIAIAEAYISVYMTLYCLLLGKQLLNKKNKVLRLISDSSYWVYLIHFPLLLIIQFYLLDVDMNIWIQFILSSVLTFGIGIITYVLLVRPTPIGWLLNGRKKR